ncbi:glycosyltransferase [Betaproteobacteria bacterium]|nr:glycosyltransferase [Betaproteobacteria bacterium]
MKVLVDLQGAQGFGSGRGIGRYSLELSRALFELNLKELDLFFLINLSTTETSDVVINYLRDFCPPEKIKGFFVPEVGDFKSIVWRSQAKLIRSAKIKEVGPDIIILTSLFEPIGTTVVSEFDEHECKYVVVLYDLIPYEDPKTYLEKENDRRNYEKAIQQLLRSDLILSISNYTTNTFLKNFREKSIAPIITIGAATKKRELLKTVPDQLRCDLLINFQINRDYILTISGQDKRKNLKTLLMAYSNLTEKERANTQLVVVCNIESSVVNTFMDNFASDPQLKSDIIFTGPVKEDDLDLLYANCKLFVFPSTKEGFGLPVLEAMAFGCPCIVSNSTTLPELVGDSALTFDAMDFYDLGTKISELICDSSRLKAMSSLSLKRSKEYSWSNVAEKATKAIFNLSPVKESSLTPQKPGELVARKKLAYISPLPPEKTGISKYSSDLLSFLCEFYDIYCVSISSSSISLADSGVKYSLISEEYFKKTFHNYDRVLYHFGNSEFHLPCFELLENFPGVVVLHEVFLDGLSALRKDHFQRLFDSHGASSNYALNSNELSKKNNFVRYPCSLEQVDQSLGLIVHSRFAKELLIKWFGGEVSEKCKLVPFLKERRISDTAIKKPESLDDGILICSFGYLGLGKMNLFLFDAWSRSISIRSKLVFVGPSGDEDYAEELKKKVNESGKSDRVIFTGWVSEEDYKYWLGVATVAVQLRMHSRGETSASLFDCFAHGVPVIVNSHGDMIDLPEDVVYKLKGDPSISELAEALELLTDNSVVRSNLRAKAARYLTNRHSPKDCAEKYFSAIEGFYSHNHHNLPLKISRLNISNIFQTEKELDCFIDALLRTCLPSFRTKTIYIDVSEIIRGDIRTGIQRVVRNILRAFAENNIGYNGLRIEPVYTTQNANQYFCAGAFLTRFLGLPYTLDDRPIEPKNGDIFLGLDLQPILIPSRKKLLMEMDARGIRIQFVVYDILPLTHREYFSPGVYNHFFNWFETISLFEKLLCISENTRKEVERFLQVFFPERLKRIKLRSFLLGNEITKTDASKGQPEEAEIIRKLMKEDNLFAMVGTIEPRKGHKEILRVFDLLWDKGETAAIVFIGKIGWEVGTLIKEIRKHKMFGNRLFWLDNCSDEFLLEIYRQAAGLLVSSLAEGYSLPIVESQNFGMPVFARDIPVFREIGYIYKNITFFNGDEPRDIAKQFLVWKSSLKGRNHREKKDSKTICWKKATKDLQKIIID